jgi:hypothetical protein
MVGTLTFAAPPRDPVPATEDEVLADYRLVDGGVLPAGFLEPSPPDLTDRLALYHAWLRSRVIRAMISSGRGRWPLPAVGLAKILASKYIDSEPSITEVVVARAVSNIAGWLALRREPFSVGTKFGQNETDLVAKVLEDYIVIECKVFKTAPNTTKLLRNLMQLLRYDDLNPAFRGRRAVLVLYNFSDVPILTPRELVGGRAWIVAINAKAGPPSKTKRCLQLHPDQTHGLRCIELGSPPVRRGKRSRRRHSGRSR